MTNLAHDTTNDTRFDDFMMEVRQFGRDAAEGKDALPKLAQAVCRAVFDGVVDTAKDKDGNDAAMRIFSEYCKSEGKKAIHNRSPESLKANVSKLRQIVTFAGNPKWDAVDVFTRAFTIRQSLQDSDNKVKPAYAAYVDVAREQLKQDTELTDDQIEAVVLSAPKEKEKTVEGELKRAAKILEDLISGEGKHGLQDQSQEVMVAAEQLNQRLAALMQQQAAREAIEQALKAGFELTEDGTLRMAA